ncbi:MAG: sigma-54 dependent transcriptional regulator [Thermodesulfobacteriota bacterium]
MEKPTKILLLDHSRSTGLGAALKDILVSSKDRLAKIYTESVSGFGTESVECVRGLLYRYDPDIIIITLESALLNDFMVSLSDITVSINQIPLLIVLDEAKPDDVHEILKLGAFDYIVPPFKDIDVLARVWQLIENTRERDSLLESLKQKLGMRKIVGQSPVFLKELEKIPIISKTDGVILILGESGTGKELFARAIHYLGPRSGKPFVPVNCGAIPTDLVENELFGHEQGAFTGASSSRRGLIHEAEEGTLFLDEIDCLPFQMQVKLLRLLQEKEYRPLGSPKMLKANIRVVSATNVDLRKAMDQGRFRKDLFYRLNVIPIVLPTLRDRKEDIPLLADHFLEKYAHNSVNSELKKITPEALRKLLLYDWPGNVRELENAIERASTLCQSGLIGADQILTESESPAVNESFKEAKTKFITSFERNYIEALLLEHGGNVTKAAIAAHKNRRAFWQLMQKHRINAKRFK